MATIGHCRGVCSPGLEVDAGQSGQWSGKPVVQHCRAAPGLSMVDSIKRGPKEVDPKGKDPDVVDSVRGGPIQVDSIGKGPSPGSWFKRGTCVPNLTTVLKMCKKK